MEKLLHRIEKVLTTVSIASVIVMVCLTTIDTVGRYLLNRPFPAANEVTAKYLMVVTVFFGFCYGYHQGSNIRVTFLVRHFPRRAKLVVDYIVQVLSVLPAILLVVSTFELALRHIHVGLLDAPNVPVGPAYMVAPVGLSVLTLWLLYDIRQVRKGKSGLLIEGEEGTPSAT